MKTKKAQARLKTKENVALNSNNIKLRRCEIKLHRFDGVGLKRNKRPQTLLQEQQTENSANNINSPKRNEKNTSPQKSLSNKEISLPKVKKCVVRLKRIHPKSVNVPICVEQKTMPQATEKMTQLKLKRCVVRLAKNNSKIDLNQKGAKRHSKSPLSRNHLLSLTSRRAVELGLKKQTTNTEPKVATSTTTNEVVNSEAQLTSDNVTDKSESSNKTLSPRNIANKPNFITELLFSEHEDSLTNPTENQNNIPENTEIAENHTKTFHKFFRKENKCLLPDDKTENHKITKTANLKRKKATNKNTKKQPSVTRRKTSKSKNDIYEFLSQSQTSDSDGKKDKDVASDIVQKLIDEGKVVVTKYYKGRPRAIRRPPKNRKNKFKTTDKKENKPINFDVENIFNNSDSENDQPNETSMALPALPNNRSASTRNDAVPTADSTFSELARSVLKRKVGNQNEAAQKHVADATTALEILQKYNSTPFKPTNSSPQLPVGADLSPIQSGLSEPSKDNASLNKAAGLLSELPAFSGNTKTLSSENSKNVAPEKRAKRLFENSTTELPSFSGSNKTLNNDKTKSIALSNRAMAPFESSSKELPTFSGNNTLRNNSNKTLGRSTTTTTNMPEVAVLSSFSSNDSNAENQPPPQMLPRALQNQENDVIHNARQIPNPRRTLAHRSPLKAINIIDIVSLPPYTGPISNKPKCDENLLKDTNNEKSQLFGFEEYLDENMESENEPANDSVTPHDKAKRKASKLNITKKLRRLRRLRPKSNSLLQSSLNSTITKNIFDDDAGAAKGNRNIKEMLCSTMINNASRAEQQSTYSSNSLAPISDSDEDSDILASANKLREKEEAELFGDPETTFDQKSLHRTYERPLKRKRKLLHPFSDIFESDHENSDDEEDALNNSVVKAKGRKAKKRQVESPQKEELNKFVSEFNSMLKEAEEYELIVE